VQKLSRSLTVPWPSTRRMAMWSPRESTHASTTRSITDPRRHIACKYCTRIVELFCHPVSQLTPTAVRFSRRHYFCSIFVAVSEPIGQKFYNNAWFRRVGDNKDFRRDCFHSFFFITNKNLMVGLCLVAFPDWASWRG
jgi:hypothetical protein